MGYAERMAALYEHAEKDAFASSHALESLVSSSCRWIVSTRTWILHHAVFTDGLFCMIVLLALLM